MLIQAYWIRKFAIMVLESKLTKEAFFQFCREHHDTVMSMKYHRADIPTSHASYNLIYEYQGEF